MNTLRKVIVFAVSLVAMIISFQLLWKNWGLTVCIVASLVFHEVGHIWALATYGVKIRSVFFVPFIYGGVAVKPGDYYRLKFSQRALVAITGPLFNGLLVSLGVLMYQVTPGLVKYGLGLMSINLILIFANLLPLDSLDGGLLVDAARGILERFGTWIFAILYAIFMITLVAAVLSVPSFILTFHVWPANW